LILAFLIGLGILQQTSTVTSKIDTIVFSGEVARGQVFSYVFHDSLLFNLSPCKYGWTISISTASRSEEDIARLTPPFHSAPNPRDIEGWHFRNELNTGPNDGSINAPDSVREFIFSPRVGLTINYPPSVEQIEQIKRDGTGTLTITYIELGNLVPNARADISQMNFSVRIILSF
jgi:hypothetical protein